MYEFVVNRIANTTSIQSFVDKMLRSRDQCISFATGWLSDSFRIILLYAKLV